MDWVTTQETLSYRTTSRQEKDSIRLYSFYTELSEWISFLSIVLNAAILLSMTQIQIQGCHCRLLSADHLLDEILIFPRGQPHPGLEDFAEIIPVTEFQFVTGFVDGEVPIGQAITGLPDFC
jgi:hypothetical protein